MKSPSIKNMRVYLLRNIADILLNIDVWGPPIVVELQILFLLELVHFTYDKEFTREVLQDRFCKHVNEAFGYKESTAPLADRLGLTKTSNAQFNDILAKFVQKEVSVLEGMKNANA